MSKFGVLFCLISGAGLAAFVLGFTGEFSDDGSAGAYIAVGANVWWLSALLGYGLLAASAGRKVQRSFAETEVPRTALARIESAQASANEQSTIFKIRMDVTIAAEGRAAFRADALVAANLMEVDAYKVGKLVVVTYDETRPWRVTVVKNPPPEWAQRLAHGAVDSAPAATKVAEPRASVVKKRRWSRIGSGSMAAGFAAGLVYFIAAHGR